VICSSPVVSLSGFLFSSLLPSGEMGIVERSTGEDGLPSPLADACATEAMVTVRFSRPAELRELAVEGGVVVLVEEVAESNFCLYLSFKSEERGWIQIGQCKKKSSRSSRFRLE
jgi:hypothetical protein